MKKWMGLALTIFALCLTVFANQLPPEYVAWKAEQFQGSPRALVGPICNSVVCVQVDDANGNFNIGTPDGRSLLYFYPGTPATSNIIVSVNGLRYHLDSFWGNACDGQVLPTSVSSDSNSITLNYTLLGDLSVVVTHTLVQFSPTTGAVLTRTVVTNNGPAVHSIGVLYEYDTTVDGDDAAELYLGPNHLTDETCFDAPFAFNYWDAIPTSGTLVGRGTFTGGQAVTPDHLAFGQWGDFYGTCWDRVCDNLPYGDSAVLYQWDEQPVQPGGSRNVATYYGVGEIQVQPGDLQISVSNPPLECINGAVQPNPFQILVNITNAGGTPCREINVHLTDGAGSGGTATIISTNPQVIPSLNPGNNAAVNFTASGAFNQAGGNICFTVDVTSTTCPPNSFTFCIPVPACAPETTWVNIGDHFCLQFGRTGTETIAWCCNLPGAPIFSWQPGCLYGLEGCNVECEPYTGPIQFGPIHYLGNWNGCNWWSMNFYSAGPGCVCVWFETQLSVELTSFTATPRNEAVQLNWETASETSNDHFNVYRANGENWELIGQVAGNGTTASANNYQFTDENLLNGTVYRYRLAAVDVNGNVDWKEAIVSATPNSRAAVVNGYALHQNFPNPFNPTTSIAFDLAEAGFVNLRVFNLMGQQVATVMSGNMSAGSHAVSFDASSLSSGVYLYKLEVNGFAAEMKMLLMK